MIAPQKRNLKYKLIVFSSLIIFFIGFFEIFAMSLKPKDKSYKNIYYNGDGKFTDRGKECSIERFLIDFGEIYLGKVGEITFRFSGLPQVCFHSGIVFNFDFFKSNKNPMTNLLKDTLPPCQNPDTIEMVIFTRADTIYRYKGSINCDVKNQFNNSFVWTNGSPIVNTSMVYGYTDSLSFMPVKNEEYLIKVTVIKPNIEHKIGRLVLTGGGWKDFIDCSDSSRDRDKNLSGEK
jgi:hypothetical protein